MEPESPRASYVMAIAALEIGVKDFVTRRVPGTAFFLQRQAPPVTEILKNRLPSVPSRLRVEGRVLPPPPAVMRVLRDAVERRNRIVHGPESASEESFEDLQEVLRCVRDTLFLLDYYGGEPWAWGFVRPETRDALEAAARVSE